MYHSGQYYYGNREKLDYYKACYWHEKATTQERIDAHYDLGELHYYGGLGGKKDLQLAHY